MHVCFVAHEFHPPFNEGTRTLLRNLIYALKSEGVEVSVVSSIMDGFQKESGCMYAEYSWVKDLSERLKKLIPIEYECDFILNYRMCSLIKSIEEKKEIDLIYACSGSNSLFLFFSKVFLRKPFVAQMLKGAKYEKLINALSIHKKVDAYITTSHEDWMHWKDRVTIYKINPPIPSDIYKPLDKGEVREVLGIPHDDFVITYVGHLHDHHSIRFPIGLIKELKDLNVKIYLYPPRENKAYSKMIMDSGAKNVTIRVKSLREYEKVMVYNASDVLMFPFGGEVSRHRIVIDPPLTVLEAMSCGKPVIASKILSIPFIIRDEKNGFLVEPDNFKLFKQKVIEIAEGCYDTKNIGKNARETIIKNFSPKDIAQKVKDVCREVIENAN